MTDLLPRTAVSASSADAPPPPPASQTPLGVPIFRAVWLASLASNFGGLVQSVGAAWLMTQLSRSPQMVALVQASVALPIMLFSLPAGAMADNWDRRTMMLGAQGFMVVVSVVLATCAALGVLTPWLLLAFTFLIGCGTAFNNPAWQASVGDMVPRAVLPSAVALNSMGFNLARSVGPALGGVIVATGGAAAAFLTNAISYVALIAVLALWRPPRAPRALPREPIGIAMAAGLRYVAMSPKIKVVLVRAAIFGFAASAVPALMPVVARDLIVGGPLIYGALLGAFGLGAVAGALASGWCRRNLTNEQLVAMAAAAVTLGAAITAESATLWVTIPALMVAGAGWVLALTSFNVAVQLSAPRWVLARGLALYQMSVFGGMAAGSWLFGLAAARYGVSLALLEAAGLQTLGLMIGTLFMPLPPAETLDLDPLGQWTEPETAVQIEPRSGPVVINIEYRIAEANIPAFLTAMAERRRICSRDGARQWTLLRDLAEADLWLERFHLPTWLDYVRTSQRRTRADADVGQAIRALMVDGQAPRVHRLIERQTGADPRHATASRDHGPASIMIDPSRAT